MILPIADETMTKATSKSLINRNRRAIPKITPSTSSMMMLFMEKGETIAYLEASVMTLSMEELVMILLLLDKVKIPYMAVKEMTPYHFLNKNSILI